MTTPSVSNVASSAPPSSANRASSRQAESAGNPFQQMLSDEMAGKPQGDAMQGELNASRSASSTSSEKASGSADKSQADAGKEDSADAPALSPELAAMIASLLQRQAAMNGAAQAAEGDAQAADPLALLAKGGGRQKGDAQTGLDGLADLADPRLAAAAERAVQSAASTGMKKEVELDLQALLGKQADTAGNDGAATEFSSTLQQLSQAAQAGKSGTAQPPATAHIAPRVGTQAWDQAIGQRVVWMASGAEQSASLTLNPPELGPLQVVLNVSNSQANATFVAPHAEVRQALEAAMPKLREMLGEAGIQLGDASVSQGTPQQQGEFARSGGQGGSHAGHSDDNEPLTMEPAVARRVTAAGNGLVDTFV